MSSAVTFPECVTKDEFMDELNKAKRIVDNGIRDYFILHNTKAFRNNSNFGNTTLKDIEEVFGHGYIELFRFGIEIEDHVSKDHREDFCTFSVRRTSKGDKKRLRNDIRFFPADCWSYVMRDAANHELVVPFIQKDDGAIVWLAEHPMHRHDGSKKYLNVWSNTANADYAKKAIEDLPDYFDCIFATVTYRHTMCIIPMPHESAKKTFASRDKGPDGKKRRLVHAVQEHTRACNGKDANVTSHLRGTSDLTIDGVDVTLLTSVEWTKKYLLKTVESKNMENNLPKAFVYQKALKEGAI